MSQRWRAVKITASDFTGARCEPQSSLSRDERVTAWPTDQLEIGKNFSIIFRKVQYLCLVIVRFPVKAGGKSMKLNRDTSQSFTTFFI